MVLLVLIGSLLCNLPLAWTTLHKPLLPPPGQTLSSPPPQNKNEWVHPIIFEPQLKIQLTQSSYKVTSFLDFQPFQKGFQSVNHYLEDLIKDLNNPGYFQRLIYPVKTFQITPLSNESTIQKFFSSVTCQSNLYGCKFKLKLKQYKLEIQYISKVFHAIYRKFLTAIDHIDYHPSQIQNITRVKRSEEYDLHGYYHSYTRTLTSSEEIFLDKILMALHKITVKLTPIVLQDYLMLILTIHLVDQFLQVNLYKVHNLPMLHPTLNVHAQYKLEGTYLTPLMEGMFVLLPTALDVKLCLVTNGHLCMFDQALYPVECINWCIYALFINDQN